MRPKRSLAERKPRTPKAFVPVAELYRLLGISRATLYGLIAEGVIPSVQDGKRKKYHLETAERLILGQAKAAVRHPL